MLKKYDPEHAPIPEDWLKLDEQERAFHVEEYHRSARIKLPSLTAHAVLHVIVETQIAEGLESVIRAMLRLTQQGLSRHDAVHAIASVLTKHIQEVLNPADGVVTSDTSFNAAVEKLGEKIWLNKESDNLIEDNEMNPTQALSETEIDELDNFLLSDEMPENCMDISALDGFFAALVINPRFIMPGEYLPWIWDMEEGCDGPAFASLDQANHIMQLLMRYYNSVLEAIGSHEFAPLFYTLQQPDESEFFDAEGWCEGFMLGVSLFGEQWEEILEKFPEFVAPMVLLGTEDGWDMLKKCADVRQATKDAYESIADTVELLYEHFHEQREAEMLKMMAQGHHGMRVEAVKIPVSSLRAGRNEECPCGSGKKFKKCCGAPPTLH